MIILKFNLLIFFIFDSKVTIVKKKYFLIIGTPYYIMKV
jgi:hypothetical protein